jgi:hypothetical protein
MVVSGEYVFEEHWSRTTDHIYEMNLAQYDM